jgi:hypothetical protein
LLAGNSFKDKIPVYKNGNMHESYNRNNSNSQMAVDGIGGFYMKLLSTAGLCLLLFFCNPMYASDLEQKVVTIIETEGEIYLKGYLKPFATVFGTSVNSAMYHRAYTKGILRFDAGLSAVYLAVPEKGKSFIYNGQEVPTLFGSNDILPGLVVPGTGVSSVLVPMFQANIGFISNLELTARYMGFKISEFGNIILVGGGIKYGLSDLVPVPLFPLDLSVQAMWHNFTLGDWITSGNFGMNLQASTSLSVLPFDIYGGIGFENTTMEIKTDAIPGNTTNLGIVSINGENSVRATIGVGYTMTAINVHVEYNFGFYNPFGMGLMIVF